MEVRPLQRIQKHTYPDDKMDYPPQQMAAVGGCVADEHEQQAHDGCAAGESSAAEGHLLSAGEVDKVPMPEKTKQYPGPPHLRSPPNCLILRWGTSYNISPWRNKSLAK